MPNNSEPSAPNPAVHETVKPGRQTSAHAGDQGELGPSAESALHHENPDPAAVTAVRRSADRGPASLRRETRGSAALPRGLL